MDWVEFSPRVPVTALGQIKKCRFADPGAIEDLGFRDSPYWHVLLQCRHLGIHRPDQRICNWTARMLTVDRRYVQRCLGPALDTGRGRAVPYPEAVERAFEWFASPGAVEIGREARTFGKRRGCVSPRSEMSTR